MSQNEQTSARLAERFGQLIAQGEIEASDLYSADGQGWHNTDEVWASLKEAGQRMAAVRSVVPDFHAEDVVAHPWPGGFAMEYVFVGTSVRGEKVRIPGCIVATVAERRINRIKEYVDSAHAAPLMGALAPLLEAAAKR